MLTYDMDFAEPIGVCRAAAWMTFQDGLIAAQRALFRCQCFQGHLETWGLNH
jgi:hypothetical protein